MSYLFSIDGTYVKTDNNKIKLVRKEFEFVDRKIYTYMSEEACGLLNLVEITEVFNRITSSGRLCIVIDGNVVDAVTLEPVEEETYRFIIDRYGVFIDEQVFEDGELKIILDGKEYYIGINGKIRGILNRILTETINKKDKELIYNVFNTYEIVVPLFAYGVWGAK